MKDIINKFNLHKFTRHAATADIIALAGINLILAVVALLKDISQAAYLGTSAAADSFTLSYFLVDTLGNNLIAAAIGVACLPVFTRLFAKGEIEQRSKTTYQIVQYATLLTIVLTVIMYVMRYWLSANFGGGADVQKLSLSLLEILLPAIVIYPLIMIGTSILQANRRFIVAALAPVLFNCVYFAGVLLLLLAHLPVNQGTPLLALAVFAGVMAQLVLVWGFIIQQKVVPIVLPRWNNVIKHFALTQDLKEMTGILLPYFLVLLSSQIVYTVERFLAAQLQTGTAASLGYVFRLVQFPIWVFVSAVSTVIFPAMSKAAITGRIGYLKQTLTKSLYATAVFTLPLTSILYFLSDPIVTIMLKRGSFGAQSVILTVTIISGYTLTIFSQGLAVLLTRASFALGLTQLPLAASLVACGINVGLDFALVKLIGAAGLGYGAAVGAMINLTILFTLLHKKLGFELVTLTHLALRVVCLNILFLPIVLILQHLWSFCSGSIMGYLIYVIVVAMSCVTMYWLGFKISQRVLSTL